MFNILVIFLSQLLLHIDLERPMKVFAACCIGATDLVSELCSGIEEALHSVEAYRHQLESMAETISSGRRCEQVAHATGISFVASEETLSHPGTQAEFEVSIKEPSEEQEVKQAKRGGERRFQCTRDFKQFQTISNYFNG